MDHGIGEGVSVKKGSEKKRRERSEGGMEEENMPCLFEAISVSGGTFP